MIEMSKSNVLRKLRAGEVVNSVKMNLADPRAVEVAALSGVDCIWLDVEHCPNTLHDIENQVRAARVYGTDTVVRVQRGSYSDLIHPLEMDATGIMVPHVMSAEDARQVAKHTRFHPIGRRPIDGGNADGAYCFLPIDDYLEQANRERFVIVQIEDPEAMDDIEAIAQVDGIDILFFGPADFSHALGIAGQMDHPKVVEGFQKVADVARKFGKFAGTTTSINDIQSRVKLGYRFLNCGVDVLALKDSFTNVVSAVRKLEKS